MKILFSVSLFLFMYTPLFGLSTKEALDSVTYMTEEYPPFNYKDKDKPTGYAVELIGEVLKRNGAKTRKEDFSFLPWARSIALLEKETNKNVLFVMAQSRERMKKYKWIGPFTDLVYSVWGRAGEKAVDDFNLLKDKKFGTVREDVGENEIRERGIKDEQMTLVNKSGSLFKLLLSKRIDYVSYSDEVFSHQAKNLGYKLSQFKKVMVLKKMPLFLGVNLSVPDETVALIQEALDLVMKDQAFISALRARYYQD